MIPYAIAIWFVTEEQEVLLKLLKQEKAEKYGENIYQPLKGWVGDTESILGRIFRLMKDEFGEYFAKNYPIERLSQIREIKFPMTKSAGMRIHFLGIAPDQQLDLADSLEGFKFAGKTELPKIKELGWFAKPDDILLFPEDYQIFRWILVFLKKEQW